MDPELQFDDMINETVQTGILKPSELSGLTNILGMDEKLLSVKVLTISRLDYCSFLFLGAKLEQIK